LRIYLQDENGVVNKPASLEGVRRSDFKLLWVDIDDPGNYEPVIKGADFQVDLPTFDNTGEADTRTRLQQRADDLLITWSFPGGFNEQDQGLETSLLLVVLGDKVMVTIHPGLEEIAQVGNDFDKGDYEHPLYSILDTVALADLNLSTGLTGDIDRYLDSIMDGGSKATKKGKKTQYDIYEIKRLKRKNVEVRTLVTSHREVLLRLTRRGMRFISADLARDLMDVVEQFWRIDTEVQNNSDLITASLDIQLNVTMKRLTTIATIFMPLTFLVGLYGMNFRHMPELTWRFGYLFAWITIIVMALAMAVIAKKKGWF
jgi:magnesium transporter